MNKFIFDCFSCISGRITAQYQIKLASKLRNENAEQIAGRNMLRSHASYCHILS